MRLAIKTYSAITSKGVFRDSRQFLDSRWDTEKGQEDYFKTIYNDLGLKYPKFFKMDALCKLAFLAAEVLVTGDIEGQPLNGEKTAVILGNESGSILSDTKHGQSITDEGAYFPSPAVFVYTLPNIMLGELCIRHQVLGENTCFVMDSFDAGFLYQYVQGLFGSEGYESCLTGWVDCNVGHFEAYLFWIVKAGVRGEYFSKFDKSFNNLILDSKWKS